MPTWRIITAIGLLTPFLLHAEATIEGSVTLPKAQGTSDSTSRYPGQPEGSHAAVQPLAVVYLEGSFSAPTVKPQIAHMAQKNLQFDPYILPIQVGTTVDFPNEDDTYHNVFSYSRVKKFDLGRYTKKDKPAIQTFDKPGVVKLFCEIHGHMRGIILVLESPHFTTTDSKGKYRLEHLPAGTYTLKAWISERSVPEKKVILSDGQKLQVDF